MISSAVAGKGRRAMELDYFEPWEFKCPCCGLGPDRMNPVFVARLDQARGLAGVPFLITSGWRCERHNAEVGGSETSSHMKGLAVDIECRLSGARFQILWALRVVGFNRIGIRKDFIHVDMDYDKPPRLVWVY